VKNFHPERMAARILGKGEVVGLVEEAERKIDSDKADKLARKLKKGKGFNLEDLRDQLAQMQQMGGMGALMDKLPGMGNMPAGVDPRVGEQHSRRMIAIINSMTPKERRRPDIINGSRKRRIASGAGLQIQDVNRLLKQHKQMEKMMKKFSGGGMKNMMRGMQGQGRLPPGMGG
jgi:signal recognition particle subunit SRP54